MLRECESEQIVKTPLRNWAIALLKRVSGRSTWRSFSDEGQLEHSIDPFALIMGLIVRIPECKICPWLLSREEVGWRDKEKEEGLEHARHILSPQACWCSSSQTPLPFGDLLHSIRRGRRSKLVFSFPPSSLLFFGGLVFVFCHSCSEHRRICDSSVSWLYILLIKSNARKLPETSSQVRDGHFSGTVWNLFPEYMGHGNKNKNDIKLKQGIVARTTPDWVPDPRLVPSLNILLLGKGLSGCVQLIMREWIASF